MTVMFIYIHYKTYKIVIYITQEPNGEMTEPVILTKSPGKL